MSWSGGWYLILMMLPLIYFIQRKKWFHWEDGTAERIATSSFLPFYLFFFFRFVIFCYLLVCLIIDNIHSPLQYQFYTVWNFTILCCYFVLILVLMVLYRVNPDWCIKPSSYHNSKTSVSSETDYGSPDMSSASTDRMTKLKYFGLLGLARFLWGLQQMMLILVLFVDLVYWIAVFSQYGAHTPLDWYESLTSHLLNLVFVYADFLCNQTRFRYAFVVFAILLSGLFVTFQWIYYPITKIWVYSILDVSSPYAILWYAGMFLSHFMFAGIAYLVDMLKRRCLRAKYRKETKLVTHEEQQPVQESLEKVTKEMMVV
jgi:hypothetical protein